MKFVMQGEWPTIAENRSEPAEIYLNRALSAISLMVMPIFIKSN